MTTPDIVLHNAEPRWISVPMIRHDSTDGTPQAGYAGSGPADTALSILAALHPHEGPTTTDQIRERLGLPLDAELEEEAMDAMDAQTRESIEAQFWEALQKLPEKMWDGTLVSKVVLRHYQAFKNEVLAPLGDGLWRLPSAQILHWLRGKEAGLPAAVTPERVTANGEAAPAPLMLVAYVDSGAPLIATPTATITPESDDDVHAVVSAHLASGGVVRSFVPRVRGRGRAALLAALHRAAATGRMDELEPVRQCREYFSVYAYDLGET